MPARDIIVIGASAGGFEALPALMANLPAELPAAVFVTMHVSERSQGILPQLLSRAGPLLAAHAVDGEPIRAGRIYIAPPDYHLVLEPGRILLSHGPKENLQRPCINVMFRSAAASYGERVAGVLLTGMLDDGVAGLWEVQQHHGTTIVQDPEEATYRAMPENAVRGLNVQYIARLDEIPALLTQLSVSDQTLSVPGEPVWPIVENTNQACPECGGAMTSVRMGRIREYRCHVGHRVGLQTMIVEKSRTIERLIEVALSQSEELLSLLHIAQNELGPDSSELEMEIAKRTSQREVLRRLSGNDKQ
ncbi:chemotaxis protein CheB [Acidobacteria bacterium AB60]|nr:chemotaxis protein CheB [Acidobacteria bacterium AB60]